VNTFKEVFGGRAGLAKTYWVYGIFGALLWAVAISLTIPGSTPALIAVLAFCTYQLAVNLGVWRAASIYTGPATWAMLGKIAAALGILISVGVIAMVFIARSGGSIQVPHRAVQPAAAPSAQPAPAATKSSDFASCLLGKLPGVANDAAAHATAQLCLSDHPGGMKSVAQGAGVGKSAYKSGAQCTAELARDTRSEEAAQLISAACRRMFDESEIDRFLKAP
jgi:hypothetical protein